MHELSIAQNIVELVTEEVAKKNALKVSSVLLEVGELAGIELDALDFAWEPATQNTLLDHSELKIEPVKGKAHCRSCHHDFNMTDLFDICPFCQSFDNEIVEGKELKIKSIDIEY